MTGQPRLNENVCEWSLKSRGHIFVSIKGMHVLPSAVLSTDRMDR